MAKEKLVKTLKIMLGMETEEVIKFAEATLKDGTKVSYDKLESGSILNIVDAEGQTAPATAGDYELEDGTIVTVDETGIITNIKPVEEVAAAEEPAAEEPAAEEPTETDKRIKELEDQIAELKKIVDGLVGTQTQMKSDFAKQSERVEEIANEPAAKPVSAQSAPVQLSPLTMAEKLKKFKK